MAFGDVLQQLRQKAEFSQAALAKQAGISVRSVQYWEQGHREPTALGILALAKALGVPADTLLKELDSPKQKPSARRPRKGKL